MRQCSWLVSACGQQRVIRRQFSVEPNANALAIMPSDNTHKPAPRTQSHNDNGAYLDGLRGYQPHAALGHVRNKQIVFTAVHNKPRVHIEHDASKLASSLS